jgi:hypothetical protein
MKDFNYFLFFILSSVAAKAQQATNTSGGTNTAGNFVVDWSFGELTLTDAARAGNLLVTQGLIQPNAGIFSESSDFISAGELKILPNPTNVIPMMTAFK